MVVDINTVELQWLKLLDGRTTPCTAAMDMFCWGGGGGGGGGNIIRRIGTQKQGSNFDGPLILHD